MSENEKSQFAARIAEMSAGIKEQGKALIEKAKTFIGDQAAVVRAWGELQAEKLDLSPDEELFVVGLESAITPKNIHHINITQVVADIFEKIKFKLKHPNRLELSGNKLLNVLTLLVCYSLIMSACGSQAKAFDNTEDVLTPTQSWTPIPPTEAPTTIPFTPTAAATTTPELSVDYLAKSENKYPLKTTEGLFDFYGTADFDNIIYKDYATPDGTVIKAWVVVEDGNQKFLVELSIDGINSVYTTLSNGPSDKKGKKYSIDVAYSRNMINAMLKNMNLSGKAKVKITCGTNSSGLFRKVDPFPSIFDSVTWDESFTAFAADGNYSELPTLDSIAPFPLLFGLRVAPAE